MSKNFKIKVNKQVALISAFAGVIIWILCNYGYTTYKLRIEGFWLIPVLCSILFIVLFLTVWIGSVITGSFDSQSLLYAGWKSMLKYFAMGTVTVFFLSMLMEYLYELNPSQKTIEPSSYIFVIDESGSMSENDPKGLRYKAVREIMDSTENKMPYMVYTFSSEPRVVRNMGTVVSGEPEIPLTCYGATSIGKTTLRILQDCKEKRWNGGDNPKVIFLTDGYATDLDNGFLWFKGNVPEFNDALKEYCNLGINISTVGLGSVDKELMKKMAETTGGVYINVDQATDLAEAMRTAATSYSERDLLSARYMQHMNKVFGFLRVLFLSCIGTLIGGLLSLAYMDEKSIPLIIVNSAVGAIIGSILFELGVQNGVYQGVLWLLLWLLFAMTLGYVCPEEPILVSGKIRALGGAKRKVDSQVKNRQELRNANIRA